MHALSLAVVALVGWAAVGCESAESPEPPAPDAEVADWSPEMSLDSRPQPDRGARESGVRDDGSLDMSADVHLVDRRIEEDIPPKDQAIEADLGRLDAQLRDDLSIAPDAGTQRDAQPPEPDAQPPEPDAQPPEPDAGVPQECVGIQRDYPASEDGNEICNFVDDDGDGLIDEGFSYELGDERIDILAEPERDFVRNIRLASSEGGFAAAWLSLERIAVRLVTMERSGCVRSAAQTITGPDYSPFGDSLHLAGSGDRFGVVYTTFRAPGDIFGGFASYVHIFDEAGQSVGEPIELTPMLNALGHNAIVGLGNGNFGVFAATSHPEGGRTYSAFARVDRDGLIVDRITHPYDLGADGQGAFFDRIIGMTYSGQVFGLAWLGERVHFMTWDDDGNVVLPPRRPGGNGELSRDSGIGWNGTHFLIPRVDHDFLGVNLISPAGETPDWSPVVLGEDQGRAVVFQLRPHGSGTILEVTSGRSRFFARVSEIGEEIGPRFVVRGPLAAPLSIVTDPTDVSCLLLHSPQDSGTSFHFNRWQCGEE